MNSPLSDSAMLELPPADSQTLFMNMPYDGPDLKNPPQGCLRLFVGYRHNGKMTYAYINPPDFETPHWLRMQEKLSLVCSQNFHQPCMKNREGLDQDTIRLLMRTAPAADVTLTLDQGSGCLGINIKSRTDLPLPNWAR